MALSDYNIEALQKELGLTESRITQVLCDLPRGTPSQRQAMYRTLRGLKGNRTKLHRLIQDKQRKDEGR